MTELPDRPVRGDHGLPPGEVYDWYRGALDAHAAGDPVAAIDLLTWAVAAEPSARSLREALARAQFDARRFDDAAATFGTVVEEDPADHYARFGLGLASLRSGDLDTAVTQLAVAVALESGVPHYEAALRSARATRNARPSPSINLSGSELSDAAEPPPESPST